MDIPALLRLPRTLLIASAVVIFPASEAESSVYYFTVHENGFPNGGDGTWDTGITKNWTIFSGNPQNSQDWEDAAVWVDGNDAFFGDHYQFTAFDDLTGGLVTVSGPVVANGLLFDPLRSEHYTLQGAANSSITASYIKLYLPRTVSFNSTIAAIRTRLIGNISLSGQPWSFDEPAKVGTLQLQGSASNTSLNMTMSGTLIRLELQKTGGAVAVNHLTVNNGDVSSDQSEQIGGILTLNGGNFFNRPGVTNSIGIFNGSGGTMHNFAGAALNLSHGVFSGNISSNGTINVNSSASMTVSGANTLEGPLNLISGELRITNSAGLGGAGSLNFGGGILSIVSGNVTADKSVVIYPGEYGFHGAVRTAAGATLALPGSVSGGTLDKGDPGHLTLAGGTDNDALILDVSAGSVSLGKASGANIHAVAGISNIAAGAAVILYHGVAGAGGGDQIYDGDFSTPAYGLVNMSGGNLEMYGRNEAFDRLTGTGTVTNVVNAISTLTLGTTNGSGTFAGRLEEAGGAARLALVKVGGGTLTLSGASNFSGGTTINGGPLFVQNPAALGTGTVTVNAGQLRLESSLTMNAGLSGPAGSEEVVSYNTGHLLTIVPANQIYGGRLTGNLRIDIPAGSAGFQAFSGDNTYDGPTTVGGYLSISGPQALGAISGGTTVTSGGILTLYDWSNAARTFAAEPLTMSDGSTLRVSTNEALQDATWQGPVTLSGGTATFRAAGANPGSLAITGTIGGAGNVRTEGNAARVIFSGAAKTFAGTTTIGSGTLTARTAITGTVALGDAATGSASTRLLLDGLASFGAPITVAATGGPATIEAANVPGVLDVNGPVTLNRPTTFQLSQGNEARLTFNGKISGNVGTLTIQGRTVLDGSVNDFMGDIVVNAGTLLQAGLGQSESIPDTAAVTLNAGSRLAITGPANETIRALRGPGGVVDTLQSYPQTLGLALPSGTETFGGVLQNGGGPLTLTKTGGGRQILTGLNTYTGATVVNGGTLEIGSGGSLYTAGTTAGTITVGNGGTFFFGRNDTFGGHLATPAASVVVNAGGMLTNGNTFNTLRNLALNGGELRATGGASANFPAFQLKGNVSTGGSVMSLISANDPSQPSQGIQLGENTATGVTTFTVGEATEGTDLQVTAPLLDGRNASGSATVPSGLSKTGDGTMELTAANTYSGMTTITGGELQVDGDLFNATSGITLFPGTGGAAIVFNATETNNRPITVSGAGTGTAVIRSTNGVGFFPVINLNGLITLNRPATLDGVSPTFFGRLTIPGKITGAPGTLTIQGRVVLDNSANDFTGDIVVVANSLLQAGLAASETIPNTAAVSLNSGSRLAITGPANETIRALRGAGGVVDTLSAQTLTLSLPSGSEFFGGKLQDGGGALSLIKTGAGTQTLTGASTYTGSTTISQGTLSLMTHFLPDSATLTIAAGATLNLGHTATDGVGALIVAGVTKPNGLYGALGSADPNDIEIAAITGTGKIRVGPPTSPFDQWALENSLTGDDAARGADPDHDGNSNAEEFILGGNPSSGSDQPARLARTADTDNDGVAELTLTLHVRAGMGFFPSGNSLAATVDGITCRIEGAGGLAVFDSPVSEVIPHLGTGAPRPGYQFNTFRLNPSGNARRGFLRARVMAP